VNDVRRIEEEQAQVPKNWWFLRVATELVVESCLNIGAEERNKKMEGALSTLQSFTQSLWIPSSVDRIRRISSGVFAQAFVQKSVPVIVSGALDDFGPLERFSPAALACGELKDIEVTVTVTPNGRADDIVGDFLVYPQHETMKLGVFLDWLMQERGVKGQKERGIPYLSSQNDNLRREMKVLAATLPSGLDWASHAFGCSPETVNIWIGDERSLSSLHRDHVENIYCVLHGEKTFTLLPPSDIACLHEAEFQPARYQYIGEEWKIIPLTSEDKVKWVPVDPDAADDDPRSSSSFPRAKYISPVRCVVRAGECLYIPALWFHQVSQLGQCVAVNYWHDMQFDNRYVMYKAIEALAAAANHY
jgi:jumonji domain-containing protein 7